jgi:hypothetical protein
MTMSFSALGAGRALLSGTIFWYSSLLKVELTPGHNEAGRTKQIKTNTLTSSGIEHVTFRIAAQCFKQLRYTRGLSFEM